MEERLLIWARAPIAVRVILSTRKVARSAIYAVTRSAGDGHRKPILDQGLGSGADDASPRS